MKKEIRHFTIGLLGVLAGVAIVIGWQRTGFELPNLITPAHAQAGTQAVLFVIGSSCPPGYDDPSAPPGINDPTRWNNRLLRLESSGDTSFGGSDTISVSQMPAHSHVYTVAIHAGLDSGPDYPVLNSGTPANTSTTGSGQPYWPRYVTLKPCVWTLD